MLLPESYGLDTNLLNGQGQFLQQSIVVSRRTATPKTFYDILGRQLLVNRAGRRIMEVSFLFLASAHADMHRMDYAYSYTSLCRRSKLR